MNRLPIYIIAAVTGIIFREMQEIFTFLFWLALAIRRRLFYNKQCIFIITFVKK